MDPIKDIGKIGGHEMSKSKNAPGKMRALLMLCVLGTVVSIGITFFVYSVSRNTAKAVGLDTVPSIIAAQNIKATLANAHSNAMNAMVTNEKLGGKFWSLYRNDLNSLHSQLVDASKSITYGDEERIPLTTISSNISAYEYTVGGAVANGAEISVDQFMEANRLMQQKILPASTELNRVNLSQLESIYSGYSKNINIIIALMIAAGLGFLALLIMIQVYLFKKTRRIFNVGLLLATILFSVNLVYSTSALTSVKGKLDAAKNDAFTSINAMWNAKAVAYNAKSIESLYLLHEGTGIVQTADTINFNLSAERICSDTKAAISGSAFEGYLNDTLSNAISSDAIAKAGIALKQWIKYVDIDKQVHNLEYDSKHDEAIALSVGSAAGEANYEFEKFDEALRDTIKIDQGSFDSSMNSAYKTLNIFPYILACFLLLIIAACILGIKPRLNEYRV